jgi:hypothetical protein
MFVRWIIAFAFIFASLPALGQTGLSLGRPGYGGPGCPDGTAQISLSRDGSALRLSFERYQASAGGNTGRTFDRKSCNLSIPVSVPAGKSVSVLSVEYRGYNRLPASANSVFTVESFLAGGQGPVFSRTFDGPTQRAFAVSERFRAATWSACGADVTLRVNSSIRVNSPGGRSASIGIRTQDVRTGLIYTLQVRNC